MRRKHTSGRLTRCILSLGMYPHMPAAGSRMTLIHVPRLRPPGALLTLPMLIAFIGIGACASDPDDVVGDLVRETAALRQLGVSLAAFHAQILVGCGTFRPPLFVRHSDANFRAPGRMGLKDRG